MRRSCRPCRARSTRASRSIAYDRLIEDPGALYVTFDNVEVGRMQAEAVLAQVPKGNYVFIKGNSADANADFLREGQQEVLQDAVDCG